MLALVGFALVVMTAAGPWLNHCFGGYALWVIFSLTAAAAGWVAMSRRTIDARTQIIIILVVAVL